MPQAPAHGWLAPEQSAGRDAGQARPVRHVYRIFGMTIASDVPLRLPAAPGVPDFPPDLEISTAPPGVLHRHRFMQQQDTAPRIRHELLPDCGLHIGWSKWLELFVSPDGRRVQYVILEAQAARFLEPYLINFAIGAALLMRGEEPLHGTALAMNGKTFALVGDSGMGKSTLAASLVAHGADLVTDDLLRIEAQGLMHCVHFGPSRLKLRADSASLWLPGHKIDGMWNPVSEKMIYSLNSVLSSRDPVQLDAIFNLRLDDGVLPSIRCVALDGAEKFAALSAATMNSLLETPERLRRQFLSCEALARAVPVYDLFYPRQQAALPDVQAEILRVLQ